MSKFDPFIGVYLMAQIFGLVVIPVYAGKCDVTKDILPGERDGVILIELKKFGFPGKQNRFEVSTYMVNNTIRNSHNTNKFYCGKNHYPDERKYLCLKQTSGIIKIREDTDFSLLYPGSTFEINIKVRMGSNVIAFCVVTINIKNNNTRTVTSPMPISNSTTGSTSSKVTTTTEMPTTKQTSSTKKPSTTTSEPLTSTTKQTPTSTSTTSKPLTTITTTTNPCADANLISYQLEQCVTTNIDLAPVMKNASIISFEWEPTSVPVKVSHLVINDRNFTASSNRKATMKIYAIMGSLKHLMKEIEAKIVKNGQMIAIGSFLPKNCSAVSVEFFIANQRISLVSDAVALVLSTFEFCTRPFCTSLYDSWVNNFASCAKHPKDNPVEQFSTCFDMCDSEQSTSKPNDIPYIWPSTSSGATATVPCKEGTGKATRLCKRINKKKSVWDNVNNRQCKPVAKRRDEDLDKLNKAPISAANASQTAQELKNLTKDNPASLPPRQLVKITDILEQLSLFAKDEKVAEEMLETVDNCMEAPDDSFLQAARTNNMSSRIVSLLSTVCEAMVESKSEFKAVKKGFALAGAKQNKTSFRGITISYQASSSSGSKANLSMVKGVADGVTESSTSLTLPPDLLLNSQGETQAILFIAYDSGKLFQERRARLNSKVISAEVKNNKISGLSNPIVTKFKINNESTAEKLCAWWDFSLRGGKGGWSTSGCNMYKSENGYTTCHCNHLTNFAVLLGADAPVQGSSHQIALSIVSYVGVAISLAGVLFTFLSYTIFPKLRENLPPKILMNLCAALALLLIVYAAGVERTSPREGCQVVAFLLHYSILSVLAWSAVEGFNSYRGIVKPMKSEIPKIMRKSAVVGWGFPLIFPIIGIAAWSEKYGDRNSCVVKGLPLYATLIAPVGVVMILNIVAIACILSALNKSSKMYSHNAIKFLHRVRIIVAFILLFSLTWLFGFLVVSNDIVAFQYIFCILNSLQGFFIFLFYCVRNENVRKSWKEKLGMTAQRPTTTSTSATTKKTDSSFDSAIYNKTDSLKSDYCLPKNGSIDSSTKIILTNRANVYSTP